MGSIPSTSKGTPEAGLDGNLLNEARQTNGLFASTLLILAGGALFAAAAFFMPVMLAVLLALTLSPLVRLLHRRGLREGLAAGLVVLMLTLGNGGTISVLGTPFLNLVDNAPATTREVRETFERLREPISTLTEMAEQFDGTTSEGTRVQQVVIAQPGILSVLAGSALSVGTTSVIVIVLTLFLLASSTHFVAQVVKFFPTLTDKKRALQTVRYIELQILPHLLTIAFINAGLGTAVGIAMWMLGMPTPLLWGLLAAILNFLPYIGSIAGVLLVGIVSLATFPTVGVAVLPPLAYLVCTAIEEQFVTPTVLGRRLRINPVSVFLAVAFWTFLWLIPGALMAVPILILLKVLCDNVADLRGIGRFLSAQDDIAPVMEAGSAVSSAPVQGGILDMEPLVL